MAQYHINSETGKPGPCTASVRQCPHGGENEHYSTPEDARKAYEVSMSGLPWNSHTKQKSGEEIEYGDKIYVETGLEPPLDTLDSGDALQGVTAEGRKTRQAYDELDTLRSQAEESRQAFQAAESREAIAARGEEYLERLKAVNKGSERMNIVDYKALAAIKTLRVTLIRNELSTVSRNPFDQEARAKRKRLLRSLALAEQIAKEKSY